MLKIGEAKESTVGGGEKLLNHVGHKSWTLHLTATMRRCEFIMWVHKTLKNGIRRVRFGSGSVHNAGTGP